ncbi:MAG: hypothetical protein WCK21_06755, partial [Actinomycetota bacterium]
MPRCWMALSGPDCWGWSRSPAVPPHHAAQEAARQQQLALDRVSRLAEANSLLFASQRVAQTLPASLDREEVLDSTVARLNSMVQHDALVVHLVDEQTGVVVPARSRGVAHPRNHDISALPRGLRLASESHKTVRLDDLAAADRVAEGTHCGLYAA